MRFKHSIAYLFITFSLLCGSASAQYNSLDQPEVDRLRSLISADSTIRRFYFSFRQIAERSMREVPRPIDTIRTEGLLQGNPKKAATSAALADMGKMYALALVYRVSGKKKYRKKAETFLTAWANQNTPNGDPIDDTNLDNAIAAYDMIKESLFSPDKMVIQTWLKRTAEKEISSPRNLPQRGTATNNWNSHRLKIIGEIAFAIADTGLQNYTIRGLKKQVEINLNPDGSSADFVSRDALHYHVYDLEPLLKLAIVLKRAMGENYYYWSSPSSSSVKKSVEWLLPYLNGQKTHPEFVNSKVQFDRDRARNNEPAYKSGTLFDPKNGVPTILMAAWFDNTLLPLARRLLQTSDRYPTWQSVLNELMR